MSCTECNDNIANPCSQDVGCKSTTYSKCIIYSGLNLGCSGGANGDTLDVILAAMDAQICAISGLNYTEFNYYSLTDVSGGAITTAQEFVEGASYAITNIVTDVTALQKPVFTRCSLFTSGPYLITLGTTTLETILQYYGEILCSLSDNDPDTITITDNCFSSSASISTLEQYIQWVVDNVCTIKGNFDVDITALENQNVIYTNYLGPNSSLSSKHDNTDCLGGTATDTAFTTINLLKTKVCAINTVISSYPDFVNMTLSYGSCFGFTATDTLEQHLQNILSSIKTYNFSSDFTVSATTCGYNISLAGGAGSFGCSDLGSCSIHNLGDVNSSLLGALSSAFNTLAWDPTTLKWRPKVLTLTSPDDSVLIDSTLSSTTAHTFEISVGLSDKGTTSDTGLVNPVQIDLGTPVGGTTPIGIKYNPNYFNYATTGTFAYNAAVVDSTYLPNVGVPTLVGSVAYINLNLDLTIPGGNIATGVSTTLGAVSAVLHPANTKFINAIAINTATDVSYNCIVYVTSGGSMAVINQSATTWTAADVYCIALSSVSYPLF